MTDLSRIPFLKLLIPYIVGITLHLYLGVSISHVFFVLSSILMLTILTVLMFRQKHRLSVEVVAFLFLLILGVKSSGEVANEHSVFPKYNTILNDTLRCAGVIDDIPVERSKTVKLVLRIQEFKNSAGLYPSGCKVLLYAQKSRKALSLRSGDRLLLHTPLKSISGPLNPHEFDFRTYYSDQGIYFQAYADSMSFLLLDHQGINSLRHFGLSAKQWLIESLKATGLSADAFAICAALLTGYDDEIDKNIMQSFAHSGTLHILSVSGLHVGLIYTLLSFLIARIDPFNRYRTWTFLGSTLILWFFALMTGFSAPVLRAVIMFSLFGIGRLFFRHRSFNSLNILFVSAFILLLADPLLIRNIGFLLSYAALFGILYFYPLLEKQWRPEGKIMKHIWQSSCVSVSATLTTLPVTLAVFHQFPFLFVVANLLVVPASFVLLILAALSLSGIRLFVSMADYLTRALIGLIELFNSEGITYADNIDFTVTDAFFISVLMFCAVGAIRLRSYRFAVFTCVILLCWQVYGLIDSYVKKTGSELVVYVTKGQSNMSIKKGSVVLLHQRDSMNFQMHVKPNLITYNYPEIFCQPFNYINENGFSMFICSQKHLVSWPLDKPITHLLVVNNGIPDEQFWRQTHLKMVLADASNSNKTVKQLKNLCHKYNLTFYDLRETGAYVKKM